MISWPTAFALTVGLEIPVVLAVLYRFGWARVLAVGLLAQLMTHPVLWFWVPRFEPYLAWVAVAETGVILCEAAWFGFWLRRWEVARPWMWALAASFAANLVSTMYGLVVYGTG